MSGLGEVVARESIGGLAAELKAQGHSIVLTNGCFDLLHVGHLRCLQAAKALGSILMVGVNADASVRALKGPGRPLTPEGERAELLAGLAAVDYAFVFKETAASAVLLEIKPEIYAKGGDYLPETLPEAGAAAACGARIVFLSYLDGYSTTGIMARAARRERR